MPSPSESGGGTITCVGDEIATGDGCDSTTSDGDGVDDGTSDGNGVDSGIDLSAATLHPTISKHSIARIIKKCFMNGPLSVTVFLHLFVLSSFIMAGIENYKHPFG